MCVRPVGTTEGSSQAAFLHGVPEGAEERLRRAGPEPCKSIRINKPSAQEASSPWLPLFVGFTKKCVYFLQLFLNSKLTFNSWKPPERSLCMCGWWPHAAYRWQIAERALSREKTPGPEPHGKLGCFLCVSCLYPSGEETARLWQGAFKTHKTVNCCITGWYLEEKKKSI